MIKVFEEITNNVTNVQYFYTTLEERQVHIEDMEAQGYKIEEKYYDADKDNNRTYVCYFSKQTELNTEVLQGLINQIEALEDGGIINLVSFVEDEGMEATGDLLMYLYDNTKHLNIKAHEMVNSICTSIKVFAI